MSDPESIEALVVGGDGLVGSSLVRRLTMNGAVVTASSRRPSSVSRYIPFDLLDKDYGRLLALQADIVFVCAAMTNMSACEMDPVTSIRINVAGTADLIGAMLKRGTFVVFLSSNTVFDGTVVNVGEEHPYCPTTEYGRQKVAAERQLLALPGADRLAIVRLSKVLTPQSGMAMDFLRRLREGHSCEAFEDLRLCPASIGYVVNGLIRIATTRIPGVFHLSGEEEMSYAQLARLLASAIGVDVGLVKPTTSDAKGVEALFRPRHPALGMTRTKNILGIRPEPTSHMINEMVGACRVQ